MQANSYVFCPYLRGSLDGAFCDIEKRLIKDIEFADISLCMNRRYETCFIYIHMLQRMAMKYIYPETSG